MMQHEDSGRFLYALSKRARKYYLGLTIISQDVEDFIGSKYGRSVINNSSMQILMKQSTASIDKVASVFGLTEGEKFLLLECEVGEGLFFAGLNHVALKVIASYTEDQLITTNPQELLEIQAEMAPEAGTEQTTVETTPSVTPPPVPPAQDAAVAGGPAESAAEPMSPSAPPPPAPAAPPPPAPPVTTETIETAGSTSTAPPTPLQMPEG